MIFMSSRELLGRSFIKNQALCVIPRNGIVRPQEYSRTFGTDSTIVFKFFVMGLATIPTSSGCAAGESFRWIAVCQNSSKTRGARHMREEKDNFFSCQIAERKKAIKTGAIVSLVKTDRVANIRNPFLFFTK